jgi:NADPH:quinone reductase-like Zn-dependent oxidoreductase
MRAAVIHGYGGPECITVEEVADPRPGPGEVVVALRAAALNHLDIWIRRGRPGPDLPMPHVLGSDGAGVVVELGEGVSGFEEDDEVVIFPGLSCRQCEACRRGEPSECVQFGILGSQRWGTFAERVCVPAVSLHQKPRTLSFPETAALPVAYLTAWRMLSSRARVRAGESVLIHGVGGGVALAALQIAKLLGAHAIVTSSSDTKLAHAVELGADHVVNYARTEDVAAEVRELTDGRGVDIAFDSVGAASWPIDLAAVRKAGRVVLCGVTTGAEVTANLQAIYWNQLTILGSTLGSDAEMGQLLRAVEINMLSPVIDSEVPLSEVREATERMERGEQFGKIVLEVSV